MTKLKYWFGTDDWAENYIYEVDSDHIRSALCEIIMDLYKFPPDSKEALKDFLFDIEDDIVDTCYYDDLCEYFYNEAYTEWRSK